MGVWNVYGGCLKGVQRLSMGCILYIHVCVMCMKGMWGVKMYLKGKSGQIKWGQVNSGQVNFGLVKSREVKSGQVNLGQVKGPVSY